MPAARPNLFDIRPLLARGVEPLPIIRSHVAALKAHETLTVVAPFLPSPLIELLRGEGFHATVEHLPDGAWRVCFYREE